MDYALPADFRKIFDDHLENLYTLSLLLTADYAMAEQCFVSGLEDCLQSNPVFREWAQNWARRTVIKNAIRMIAPLRNGAGTVSGNARPFSDKNTTATAIASLPPFDRFVFVLSVLERISDRECSLLMDCSVEQVVDARIRALQRIATVGGGDGPAESALRQGAA